MFKATQVLAADYIPSDLAALREAITQNYVVDENAYLAELSAMLPGDGASLEQVTQRARTLVTKVRKESGSGDGIDAFLQEYSLDTQEGIILMCLAEALLRIPDAETADALIKDKLSGANWSSHFRKSDSTLVNASTWGLMLTGKIIKLDKKLDGNPANLLGRMVNKLGEPVVRSAMYAAMKIMGKQFVLGRDMKEALKASRKSRELGYTHTYDMLGESALTMQDADKYLTDYRNAIEAVGNERISDGGPAPSISIKLSALHPRYDVANRERVLGEMCERLVGLVRLARDKDVAISIDAEEMDRLELSLDLFEQLYRSDANRGWGKLGMVVQAYSKRALPVLCWLTALAREQGDLIPVRLVKGAYWDSELKYAQQAGLPGYPLFTRKAGTDISYLACARYLLSEPTRGFIAPQFATHNANTVVSILEMAGDRQFEFQRLHGMGEELHNAVLNDNPGLHCRIYAPVGAHKDLLPYLVRRLLENGANTSFVHKLVDPNTPVDSLAEHPLRTLKRYSGFANDRIPQPVNLFIDRKNSSGVNMNILSIQRPFFARLKELESKQWLAGPIVDGETLKRSEARTVLSPQDVSLSVGKIHWADEQAVEQALASAHAAFPRWRETPVSERAAALEKLADLLEANREQFVSLCTREAGKLLQDGIDEVREAVDFCRYYAVQARSLMGQATLLPGYTGEQNELFLQGRGVFVCISPWNFPLAIFLGQIAAALATGNTVIAKPAEQTGLIAHLAVILAHQAGIPGDVLQLLPGDGATVGAKLTADPRIGGVCFTGSTETAKLINMALAQRDGAILPLIAETGGQNAMIVDSTALPEQVVRDVVSAAFQSAGQRCSALRVLYLQEEIAERVLEILTGAMQELKVGNPAEHNTDVGPVIDADAKSGLDAHLAYMIPRARLIAQAPMPAATMEGHFVQPTALEIGSIRELAKEQFGPILHVLRYATRDLDKVISDINGTGYGLTLGIHSRNESHAEELASRINVGNVYINRNQIGAMVGVQPFGGQGLSGTGPKAGGPHYLSRFVTEKTRTINTTAVGGNASLLAMGDA
ncbi:bifunctional proline dehydrogenase/L-glutamate gamma-semialdehyde dehydrogenase PutA [Aeromonas veronii]|uniref:bifunctional proline dehydrogenase/L-glutamate gamma-semialdehyde dehydrogenase PutA n=1 Tax=Aeromonas veronii TaxID=654 RepID=UPI00214D39D2|nr:bifunctional proline dehydrogenase/L-glutamate gamma-semialdehyde dehydrogenase PutA [Aeromonas veronii]MCR3968544.1 bifunctional proline dehydrogenase/L-glutamate gamma-semialdehyde dehydrogenase PutA [Aeromonas veronii]MCR3980898.1 bifunctional proline dehydrogenase/L-glutamate gamma-semialdehyde dehydrogenase PutA [Aeromonas veronii]